MKRGIKMNEEKDKVTASSQNSIEKPDEDFSVDEVDLDHSYEHGLEIISYDIDEFKDQEDVVRDTEDLPFISTRAEFIYRILSVLFTIAIGFILLFMVANSPISHTRENNPTLNEVPVRYIEDGVEEAGATNIVAGVLLDYRAFDTFGEAAMVFSAAIGVIFLIKDIRFTGKEDKDVSL